MVLKRQFETLKEARAVYRKQLARKRLFVPTDVQVDSGADVTIRISISETGGHVDLPGRVVRSVDAETAREHSLGDSGGVVIAVALTSDVREPLRALLTGELRTSDEATSGRGAARRKASPSGKIAKVARDVRLFIEKTEDGNHYEVLGVDPSAGRADIRKAYMGLIRRFHPDNYFQQVDGETQLALETAYQRVTTAYETLADRKRRDKYDVSIGHFGSTSDGSGSRVKREIAELEAYRAKNATGIKRAKELWESALEDVEAGDLKGARNKLRLAMTFDPRNPVFKRKLDELGSAT